MKRTITEVQKDLNEKRSAVKAISDLLETEKRSMTDDELASFNTLETEIRSLNSELEKLNAELRMRNIGPVDMGLGKGEEGEIENNFSFTEMIRSAADKNGLVGFAAEMHQEGVKEMQERGLVKSTNSLILPEKALRMIGKHRSKRSVSVTGSTSVTGDQGGLSVATDIGDSFFVGALRSESGLGQLGARFITDLRGDFQVPFGKNVASATWEGEEDSTSATQLNMDSFKGQPKRVSVLIPYTTQMLRQTSIEVERWIQDEALNSIGRGLDEKAINGSGSGSNPKGILNYTSGDGVNVVTITSDANAGGAITNAKVVDLESALGGANGIMGNMGYYTNAKVRGAMKKIAKESGGASGYIWNTSDPLTPVNGYACVVSNNVPSNLAKGTSGTVNSALIFASWEELFLMQWGGMEIIVDPYSAKKTGNIEIQIDTFWDIKLRRKGCFGYIKDITTA